MKEEDLIRINNLPRGRKECWSICQSKKDQYAYKISRTPIPALLEVIKQGDVKLIREIKGFITNDIKILQEEYQDIISESEAGIKEALEL